MSRRRISGRRRTDPPGGTTTFACRRSGFVVWSPPPSSSLSSTIGCMTNGVSRRRISGRGRAGWATDSAYRTVRRDPGCCGTFCSFRRPLSSGLLSSSSYSSSSAIWSREGTYGVSRRRMVGRTRGRRGLVTAGTAKLACRAECTCTSDLGLRRTGLGPMRPTGGPAGGVVGRGGRSSSDSVDGSPPPLSLLGAATWGPAIG